MISHLHKTVSHTLFVLLLSACSNAPQSYTYPLTSEDFVDEYHDFDWTKGNLVDNYQVEIWDYREYKYSIQFFYEKDTLRCGHRFHKGDKDLWFQDIWGNTKSDTLMMEQWGLTAEEYNKKLIDVCFFALNLHMKYQVVRFGHRKFREHDDIYVNRTLYFMCNHYNLSIFKELRPLTPEILEKRKQCNRKYDAWFYTEQRNDDENKELTINLK